MATIATPTDNRETKRAGQLVPGDWIIPGYLIGARSPAEVMYTLPYWDGPDRRPMVMVIARDPLFDRPDHIDHDAAAPIVLALPDEVPEDPMASGRDITEPDETPQVPDGVYGPLSGTRAAHTFDGDQECINETGPCNGPAEFQVTTRTSDRSKVLMVERPFCFRHGLELVERAAAAASIAHLDLEPIPANRQPHLGAPAGRTTGGA